MNPREYMIKRRKSLKLTRQALANRLEISERLIEMLEEDDQCVTHPLIVKRIAQAYKLTEKQATMMLPENYLPGPNYDPDRYKSEAVQWIS